MLHQDWIKTIDNCISILKKESTSFDVKGSDTQRVKQRKQLPVMSPFRYFHLKTTRCVISIQFEILCNRLHHVTGDFSKPHLNSIHKSNSNWLLRNDHTFSDQFSWFVAGVLHIFLLTSARERKWRKIKVPRTQLRFVSIPLL